jgi:hypothetical protein
MVKRFLVAAAVAAVAARALVADAGVSVQIGEPGFYGSIDIGGFPQPQLIYPQPVMIQREPVQVELEPIYLHVPPGHAKHWAKHCHRYNACGRQVYFVQNSWYDHQYVPRYREIQRERDGQHHGDDRGHVHGKSHGKGHGHDDD